MRLFSFYCNPSDCSNCMHCCNWLRTISNHTKPSATTGLWCVKRSTRHKAKRWGLLLLGLKKPATAPTIKWMSWGARCWVIVYIITIVRWLLGCLDPLGVVQVVVPGGMDPRLLKPTTVSSPVTISMQNSNDSKQVTKIMYIYCWLIYICTTIPGHVLVMLLYTDTSIVYWYLRTYMQSLAWPYI